MNEHQQLKDHDTIVALATGPSGGAIAIVRLSGPKAASIFQQLAHDKIKLNNRQIEVGHLYDSDGHLIDFAVCLYFKGPRSFTGEDVVEMQLHASIIVVQKIIDHCLKLGARHAEAGEFSKRAYLNGKADLTKLESTAALIAAQSEAEALAAMRTMQGMFAEQVTNITQALMHLRMMLEAHMDFTDEDIAPSDIEQLQQEAHQTMLHLNDLIAQTGQGSVLRDGLNVVIVGAPNVGKSSLMNALAKQHRSIVSDIAGTTRDIIRDHLMLGSLKINLADTAGLCDATDLIEQQGIALAKETMQQADVVWLMLDSDRIQKNDPTILEDIKSIQSLLSENTTLLILENKIDLTETKRGLKKYQGIDCIALSAKEKYGLHDLENYMMTLAGLQITESTLIVKERHMQCLRLAQEAMLKGLDHFHQHQALELFAEDCHQAQRALEPIIGKVTSDDVLGEIFSNFCIGK